jgi:iron complex outermembrane receptor protein
MKHTVLTFIFSLLILTINAQTQPNVIHGKIFDNNKNIFPGASVIIVGTKYGVNANETGEYLFNQIPAGRIKLQVSFVGFKTLIADFDVQPGQNYLDLTLLADEIKLDGVTVIAQKREQQILDVPITMSVINTRFIEENNITELDKLSEFVPGLLIRMSVPEIHVVYLETQPKYPEPHE